MYSRTLATIVAAAITVGAGAAANARDLTIVSWGGAYQTAQKKVYFEPFKQEAKIPLIDESWDGGIGVLRAKVQGGASTWDVVQVESDELAAGCEEGLFVPLDYSKIGGKDNYIAPAVHECGVGAILYDFVLGYDKDKIKDPPKSWADFFDTKKYPGKRALRAGPKTTLEIALMADGVATSQVYPCDLNRAFKSLDKVSKHIDVWWTTGAQVEQMLTSGEVAMVATWASRAQSAMANGAPVAIVWDQNIYGCDNWSILKGTPKADACRQFIKFASDPKRQAALTEYFPAGLTQPEAFNYVKPEIAKNCPTFPENIKTGLHIDAKYWLDHQSEALERFNSWILT